MPQTVNVNRQMKTGVVLSPYNNEVSLAKASIETPGTKANFTFTCDYFTHVSPVSSVGRASDF